MIYFILCRTTSKVKIGFAADPWKRLSKIQSDTPEQVELLAMQDGDKTVEQQLHLRFAAHWSRGEWFNFTPEIKAHIGTLPTPIKEHSAKRLGGALGTWLYENRITLHEFGKMVGSTKSSLSGFCAGTNVPRKGLMERIYVATHGAVQPNDFFDLPNLSSDRKAA